MPPKNDPIDRVQWVDAETLTANNYNPNVVVSPELRLLEHSILCNGWIQPVLVSRDNEIIDGFHRWSLACDSKKLRAAYGGQLPVAVLDVSRAEGMMLTVRINRAKGTHVAVLMSKVVCELINVLGLSRKEVAEGIGATPSEVDLLCRENVFRVRDIANATYSKAWVPVEAEARPPQINTETRSVRRENPSPVAVSKPSDWRQAPLDHVGPSGKIYHVRVCSWDEVVPLKNAAARDGLQLKQSAKCVWFAALDGEQVVAVAGLLAVKPGFARVRTLYVSPEHRSQGLGSVLFEVRLAAGLAQHFTSYEVIAKYPAMAESFGFRTTSMRNGFDVLTWSAS